MLLCRKAGPPKKVDAVRREESLSFSHLQPDGWFPISWKLAERLAYIWMQTAGEDDISSGRQDSFVKKIPMSSTASGLRFTGLVVGFLIPDLAS